jgi:hypothetical protein
LAPHRGCEHFGYILALQVVCDQGSLVCFEPQRRLIVSKQPFADRGGSSHDRRRPKYQHQGCPEILRILVVMATRDLNRPVGFHEIAAQILRPWGVKNGTLGTVAEVNRTSMRVQLEGAERREIRFMLADYAALDYGYAATVHKAQGATLDRTFLLATPGMDRHLAYVGMTRHREDVGVYAGRDDFKSFDGLRERLSRARPKDSTLDYAQRRGLETERTDDAETGRPEQKARQWNPVPVREASAPDPIARFKAAQKEFIQVAGIADFDPNAKARATELREVMKQTSQEIAKDSTRIRAAELEGIAPQVRNFARQAENERGREKGRGLDRDEGLER